MHGRVRGLSVALAAALAVIALAACGGGGSQSASTLLKQTFSGSHTGKLPKSNFNISISALGHTGTLGILSTGTSGYVSLQGTSYQLPQATFQKLESSFSSVGGSSGGGLLGKLGINPLDWLVHPAVAGTATIAGASTTHIRAGIDVPALLRDLNTFLAKASTIGVSAASHGISPATQSKIASEVRNPEFDVWTGTSDKTVRKLSIGLTLPVSGEISTLFGGLTSAGVTLTMQYADLNQPQNIVAPTSTAPYSQFEAKIQTILQAIESAIGSQLPTSGGSTSSGSPSTGSSSAVNNYSQCITQADGDVAKMQKCASLLGGQ